MGGTLKGNTLKILIDSREQSPLEFKGINSNTILRKALCVGDYMVEFKNGYVPPVSFERKSIGDLFGTLGKGYKRFKKELDRASKNNIKLILIIEGNLSKVIKGYRYSEMKGATVVKRLFTIWIKYDLQPVFVKDRNEMSIYITEYFSAIGRIAGRK